MKAGNYGYKAESLLKLSRKFSVPEFKVLGPEFFISRIKYPEKFLKAIKSGQKSEIYKLASAIGGFEDVLNGAAEKSFLRKGGRLIARSSSFQESAEFAGAHGLFASEIFSAPSGLNHAVKKVWLSFFSVPGISFYERGKGLTLPSVILQRYVEGRNGRIFLYPSENEFYAQWGLKDGETFHCLFKNGNSYFSDFKAFLQDGPILSLFSLRAKELCSLLGLKMAVVEFVIREGELFVLQAGPCDRPDVSSLKVRFENEANYDFHFSDFDEKFFNAVLSQLGFKSRIKPLIGKDGLFLSYGEISYLEMELAAKAREKGFSEKFRFFYLDFLKREAMSAKKTSGGRQALSGLKSFNFKTAALNFLYTRIIAVLSGKKSAESSSFRNLYSFKNTLKKYNQPIVELYEKKIISDFPNLSYESISEICKIQYKDGLPSLSRGFSAKEKMISPLPGIKASFPIKGLNLAPGRARGPVRLLLSPESLRFVRSGEIVVGPYIDSFMASAILKSAGCITSTGGFFSHAAVNARELGKPCAGGISGCERIFSNGDMVEIRNGTVNKI
ncbi:MAG: hypothetical protein Fur0012_09020 [Elusimicrobiota bacterium]